MAKVVGELEGKRRRSAVHVSFEGSGRGPEGCPARGAGAACLLVSYKTLGARWINFHKRAQTGNGSRVPALQIAHW